MRMWTNLVKCIALFAVAMSVNAQSPYPSKPIRLVVANPPGGQTDVASRLIAQHLSAKLGQNVFVDNRPGASSNLGANHVAQSAPDGYTLIVAAINNFGANPALIKNMPFDPVKDFKMIVQTIASTNVLVVNINSPFNSLTDIIKAAKADPKALSYGSAGPGSSMFLFMEMLKSMAGIEILHVPYQGSAPAGVDVMGNVITMVFDSMPGAWPLVEGKKLKAIAVSSAQRSPAAPHVPTVAESGVPGFEAESWLGFAAPAGTPDDIIQKLNSAVNEVLKMPQVRDQLLAMGTRPVGGTSAEFQSFVENQVATWKKVLHEAGISPN
jgi:tripartite-type tricarboxylate transporter receptor subunit TctC